MYLHVLLLKESVVSRVLDRVRSDLGAKFSCSFTQQFSTKIQVGAFLVVELLMCILSREVTPGSKVAPPHYYLIHIQRPASLQPLRSYVCSHLFEIQSAFEQNVCLQV